MVICMLQIFNGYVVIFLTFLAVSADTIIDSGEKIGTSSNQVLLGMLVFVLILVVIYLGRKQDRAARSFELRQDNIIKEQERRHDAMVARLDAEQKAFGDERKQRIEFLMKLVADITVALNRTATAEQAMATSVESLKIATVTNTEVTRTLVETLKKRSGEKT